ncbi:MAG: HAD family hydrolase [Cytophagales bacterium]|nr:HAD family hydrolase [Cytophagales bacterium]
MENKNKCVFLDRDGVLNVERGEYTFRVEDFQVEEGVGEALRKLKEAGYLLIVITNQAGIAKELYSREDVLACHEKLQKETGNLIDALYYCPHHPLKTESLARKPEPLMFERAIAKYGVDPEQSWMVGDKERDLIPSRLLGLRGIRVDWDGGETISDYQAKNLLEASEIILNQRED